MDFVKNFEYYKFSKWLLKNSYQLQEIPTNFNFFNVCTNHNEQHIGGWKSYVPLKLVSSTTPCSECSPSNCNKSLNFQNFLKVQDGSESKFCKLYFVS
jgi:hypothetical protein